MLDHHPSPFRVPSALLSAAFALSLLLPLTTTGCYTTCTSCDSGGPGGPGGEGGGGSTTSSEGGGGSGGAAQCTSSQGTLEGIAYINAAPGQPGSAAAANATIVLQNDPTSTPLYGMADETGHFSIPLDAGQWLVGGEHSTNCETAAPVTVLLDPCETEQVELVLDQCFDG